MELLSRHDAAFHHSVIEAAGNEDLQPRPARADLARAAALMHVCTTARRLRRVHETGAEGRA